MRRIALINAMLALTIMAAGCKKEEIIEPHKHFGYGRFEARLNGKKWSGLGQYYEHDSTGSYILRFRGEDYKFDFFGELYVSSVILGEESYEVNAYNRNVGYYTDSFDSERLQISYNRWLHGDQFVNRYESIQSGEVVISGYDDESGKMTGSINDIFLLPFYQEGDTVFGAPVYVEMEEMKITDFQFTIYEKEE